MDESHKMIMLKRLIAVLTNPKHFKRRFEFATRRCVHTVNKSYGGPYLCLIAEYHGGADWRRTIGELLDADGIWTGGSGFEYKRAPAWLVEQCGLPAPDDVFCPAYARAIRITWLRHQLAKLS